jgi:hypothetical protein
MTTIVGSQVTPVTGFNISGADLMSRFDPDSIARLASDDRAAVLSRADTAIHPNVTAALSDAKGRFMAAVQFGGRYRADDLNNLTAESLEYAKRIVCTLAMAMLMGRRLGSHAEERQRLIQEAQMALDFLSAGKDVFTLTAQLDAGLLEHQEVDEAVIINRDLRVERLKGHLFSH